jgi:autotransporter-associated beta strand protein
LAGSGALTKSGAGTVVLSSATNSYTGTTTVGGGVLRVTNLVNANNNSSIGAGTTVILTNGGVLDYAGTTNSSMNRGINLAAGNGGIGVSNSAVAVTISGAISNTGTLVKSGAGTLILTASNTYSGGTLLNAGTLAAGNAFAFGAGSVTIGSGTTLNLSNLSVTNVLINNGGTLTNLGTVSGAELNAGSTTIASSNSTVAEVSGTAQVTVSGVNTTITNVTGGTVSIAGTNTTLQTVDAGTLNIAGTNTTVQTLNGGTVNVTNGRTLVVQSGSSAGAISGGGGLVKSGTSALILSGDNTFTGGAFLNEGTLRLASATAAGGSSITQSNGSSRLVVDTTGTVTNQMSVFYLQSLQTVTLSGAKTLNNATYDITNNTTTTESGTLSGSGGITKLGTGTLAITASNTFTGAVDVQAGVLNLNSLTGSAAGGTTNVAVASGATLLISQNNQVNNAATVSLTGGTIRTASGVSEAFGNLTVTGSGFLDFGTTSYANANTINFGTYTPSALLTIDNFDYGSTLTFGSDLTSTINNSSFFTFNNGGIASSSWNGTTFTITAIPEPSTYLAAAGLLGLMLWPSRRRILAGLKSRLGLGVS